MKERDPVDLAILARELRKLFEHFDFDTANDDFPWLSDIEQIWQAENYILLDLGEQSVKITIDFYGEDK